MYPLLSGRGNRWHELRCPTFRASSLLKRNDSSKPPTTLCSRWVKDTIRNRRSRKIQTSPAPRRGTKLTPQKWPHKCGPMFRLRHRKPSPGRKPHPRPQLHRRRSDSGSQNVRVGRAASAAHFRFIRALHSTIVPDSGTFPHLPRSTDRFGGPFPPTGEDCDGHRSRDLFCRSAVLSPTIRIVTSVTLPTISAWDG